jgi:hypothetical protein
MSFSARSRLLLCMRVLRTLALLRDILLTVTPRTYTLPSRLREREANTDSSVKNARTTNLLLRRTSEPPAAEGRDNYDVIGTGGWSSGGKSQPTACARMIFLWCFLQRKPHHPVDRLRTRQQEEEKIFHERIRSCPVGRRSIEPTKVRKRFRRIAAYREGAGASAGVSFRCVGMQRRPLLAGQSVPRLCHSPQGPPAPHDSRSSGSPARAVGYSSSLLITDRRPRCRGTPSMAYP